MCLLFLLKRPQMERNVHIVTNRMNKIHQLLISKNYSTLRMLKWCTYYQCPFCLSFDLKNKVLEINLASVDVNMWELITTSYKW